MIGDYVVYDASAHIRQALFSALMKIGEFLVIYSQEVKNRGMDVVKMDFVLDGFKP